MADSDYSDRRHRRRSLSASSGSDRDRKRVSREKVYSSSSRRRDHYRSSHGRKRLSPSSSSRDSHRRDGDYRPREHRDREERRERPEDDRRRSEGHRPRRHRELDSRDDRDRPSRTRRSISRSRSPISRARNSSPRGVQRSKGPLPSQSEAFTSNEVSRTGRTSPPPPEKEKPNFAPTGRLAAESNTVTVNGSAVVLKYHEPPEARKPPAKEPWRLYVFKGNDLLEVVELSERSCWLVGRERLVVDFPLDHPSCSKQHAAIQFRFVEKRNEFGDKIGRVRPYLIDLDSANGSSVNGDPIPPSRYVELRDKDVVRFGHSSREYVLMLPPPE